MTPILKFLGSRRQWDRERPVNKTEEWVKSRTTQGIIWYRRLLHDLGVSHDLWIEWA